ncbi:unnamed protein product [Clonostachys rosea]|uniref:Calcineurin-like phosphoesterase domain-containing protein n=1 Tax=Bionectria ochroleuca TaxID=29856 RepID=A0ABY6UIJ8_BIOOC|nr:unnamed protein product [Clonostachys rosea]
MSARSSIKLRRTQKCKAAEALHQIHSRSDPPREPVRVVCISDTHNNRPELPPGDLLIHAGDLTENGSFDEVQAGLAWLASQPHTHKIFVAGSHDVLFDEDFLTRYPERRYGQTRSASDLDWGGVIYLRDNAITLTFPTQQSGEHQNHEGRNLVICGSPWTSQDGRSAFQYRPDDEDHWRLIFANLDCEPDIIVTHGPPKYHLDNRDFQQAGCPYLAEEIARARPLLSVFGHIHASYGREDCIMDGVQTAYEDIMVGWGGWMDVMWMACLVVSKRLGKFFRSSGEAEAHRTIFVNASIVGPDNEMRNDPIVVEL